jgi:hypothetical protein
MKAFVVSCALVAAVAAALAGQMKYGVTVRAEKDVDFSKFKTYSWTQGQPSADRTIDAQIMAAVDRELGVLGMTKASSGSGDVMLAYYSLSRTDVDLKAKPDAAGVRPQYTVGSLTVALLELQTRRRLLQLRTDKPIDMEPARLEAEINSVVAELFTKFPTRQQQ